MGKGWWANQCGDFDLLRVGARAWQTKPSFFDLLGSGRVNSGWGCVKITFSLATGSEFGIFLDISEVQTLVCVMLDPNWLILHKNVRNSSFTTRDLYYRFEQIRSKCFSVLFDVLNIIFYNKTDYFVLVQPLFVRAYPLRIRKVSFLANG